LQFQIDRLGGVGGGGGDVAGSKMFSKTKSSSGSSSRLARVMVAMCVRIQLL